MIEDIVGFIRARLAEDEALASGHGIWRVEAVHTLACAVRMNDTGWEPQCRCEVPARILRGVEAKRRTLGEVIPGVDGMEHADETILLVGLMATEWSDHVDYRQEWAPPELSSL
jgi:Family of unknown function (DUF6221)